MASEGKKLVGNQSSDAPIMHANGSVVGAMLTGRHQHFLGIHLVCEVDARRIRKFEHTSIQELPWSIVGPIHSRMHVT
jgi:hypothetical protein